MNKRGNQKPLVFDFTVQNFEQAQLQELREIKDSIGALNALLLGLLIGRTQPEEGNDGY